jgi:hypothetical protein
VLRLFTDISEINLRSKDSSGIGRVDIAWPLGWPDGVRVKFCYAVTTHVPEGVIARSQIHLIEAIVVTDVFTVNLRLASHPLILQAQLSNPERLPVVYKQLFIRIDILRWVEN